MNLELQLHAVSIRAVLRRLRLLHDRNQIPKGIDVRSAYYGVRQVANYIATDPRFINESKEYLDACNLKSVKISDKGYVAPRSEFENLIAGSPNPAVSGGNEEH